MHTTVQSQALVECHYNLVSGLQSTISSLGVKCYSKYLISEDTFHSINELNLTNAEKAVKVLLNVEQIVQQKKEKFEEFVKVLSELKCCDDLVEELSKKFEQLSTGKAINFAAP